VTTRAQARFDDAGSVPNGWKPAVRCDVGRLSKLERTSSGGVRVPGAVARAGILTYRRADGSTVRELVPPDEVGRADSLGSLRDAPVTIGHPDNGQRMVTPETYRADAVGHVSGDPRVDGDHLVAELAILDSDAIKRIDAGELVELSSGYRVMIEPTAGSWNGERYDQIQRRREYNHVALLPEGGGRAGASVALRVDGEPVDVAWQVGAGQSPAQPEKRADSMETERIDGIDYKVGSPEWRQAHAKRQKRLDEEMEALQEEKEKADMSLEEMTAERDTLKAKLEELEAKIAEMESPERADARINERVELLEGARRILGPDVAFTRTDEAGKAVSMSDREVRVAALSKLRPDFKWDERDDVYVRARFDAELELLKDAPSDLLVKGRADAFGGNGNITAPPVPASNQHTVGREAPPSLEGRHRR